MKTQDLKAADEVRRVFDYDPLTGVMTRRITLSSRAQAGQQVGTVSHGYLLVAFQNRKHRVHRLVWLYVFGAWPSGHIDHINGVRGDNRIANLRLCNDSENGQNLYRPKRSNLSSGLLGVHLHGKKYRAALTLNRRVYRSGVFSSPEEAAEAYAALKRSLHPFGNI